MDHNKIIKIKPLGFPWATHDPFLFCAYHRDEYPKGNDEMGPDDNLDGRYLGQDFVVKDGYRMYHGDTIPGFPYHPHRGFETITINKEGWVDHFDSLGATGRFGEGDVQWMTAGKGIQHSEMFPLIHKDKENPLEIFQVWLNLPKASKFVDPHFKMLWKESIPMFQVKDNNGNNIEVNVIAGKLNNTSAPNPTPNSWAANPDNEVAVLAIKLEANAEWILPGSNSKVNRTLYFYKGSRMEIDNQKIPTNHSIRLQSKENVLLKAGDENCYLLMLQGRPINEPVAKHGPFVMNTQLEIQEAFQEYRQTQFGGWPWKEKHQVHDRNKGKFAIHANGVEELLYKE